MRRKKNVLGQTPRGWQTKPLQTRVFIIWFSKYVTSSEAAKTVFWGEPLAGDKHLFNRLCAEERIQRFQVSRKSYITYKHPREYIKFLVFFERFLLQFNRLLIFMGKRCNMADNPFEIIDHVHAFLSPPILYILNYGYKNNNLSGLPFPSIYLHVVKNEYSHQENGLMKILTSPVQVHYFFEAKKKKINRLNKSP